MKWQEVSIEGLVDVHIHSAPDIAARWGVTPGRVSQIERSARERVLTKWRA